MGFWDKASDALGTGVQLGVRAQDRAEDREERRLDREQRKEQWEATNKRAEAAETRAQEDFDEKKQFKVVTKLFNSAHALYQAGVEANDDGMMRQGAQKLVDTYNQYLPNGDETRIIFKKDSVNNPVMQAKWDEDKNLKGKEVAILSRSGGIMPFKNLDDAFNYAAANLSMENFTAGVKQAKAKVADLNAKEEPFMGNDGQYYTRRWKMGKGGMPEKSEPIPYTGVTKASKLKQDVTDTETVLGKKLSSEEQRIKAGLSKPETASEAELHRAQAAKARAEGSAALGGEGGKGGPLKGADLDKMKKSLNLLLTPFAKKGESVLDPETGEMTQAGNNAYEAAADLVDKAQNEPEKLTKKEKRDLPHAVRAVEIFKRISASVTAGYISKEDAAAMGAGKGAPANYKDGNWHVIPNGEHKGKEARYNEKTKKYEIRARGGASASFDGGEPAPGVQPSAAGIAPPVQPTGKEEPAPEAAPPAARREPTAMEQNATRAGLVAGHAGVVREEDALSRYIRSDKEIPPFEGEPAYEGGLADALGRPIRRVMDDYEYQQARSRR